MSRTVLRSPRSEPLPAALTPERFAQEFGRALWRHDADGRLEVATMRNRSVERYIIDADGATSLVASRPPTALERHASKLGIASWGLSVASIFAAAVVGDAAVLGAFVGFAGFAYFGYQAARADDLAARLKKHEPGEWHEPPALNGWVPRSTEQLAAVEQIADDHDGLAFVRSDAAPSIEVRAARRGVIETYWVDDRGRSGLAEVERHARSYWVERVATTFATLLIVAACLTLVTAHFVLAGALAAAFAVILAVALRQERAVSLEARVKQSVGAGATWREIRTRAVDDTD
jgi:hypothetical protein